MSGKSETTADRMVAYMREHNPPREVYHSKRRGYFMTYPGDASPRPQVSLDVIYEALRRGLIRTKYPGTDGYWELASQ